MPAGDRVYRIPRHVASTGRSSARLRASATPRRDDEHRTAGSAAPVRRRQRAPAPRDRRRERRTEPLSEMPIGDQSRAAVDASPSGAAHRAGRTSWTDEARARRAPARDRHLRRRIGGDADGTHATSCGSDWQHACPGIRETHRRHRLWPRTRRGTPRHCDDASAGTSRRRSACGRDRRSRAVGTGATTECERGSGSLRRKALHHCATRQTHRTGARLGLSSAVRRSRAATALDDCHWRSRTRSLDHRFARGDQNKIWRVSGRGRRRAELGCRSPAVHVRLDLPTIALACCYA